MRQEVPNSYSQSGEDLMLAEIFGEHCGTIVDVGAHDGVYLSNSYLLELLGWNCILIEPNPQLFERILTNRHARAYRCAATSADGEVAFHISPDADAFSTLELTDENSRKFEKMHARVEQKVVHGRRLDSILEESGVSAVDVVSIDVEGHESAVFSGFTVPRWKPRVFIVEGNTTRETFAISRLLAAHGYVRFHRSGVNDWYARREDRTLASVASRIRIFCSDGERLVKNVLRTVLPVSVRRFLSGQVLAPR